MVRLAAFVVLSVVAMVTCTTEGPAADMPNNPSGGTQNYYPNNQQCQYVQCAYGFSCMVIPDSYNNYRPHCVRQNPDCDDLTDYDDRRRQTGGSNWVPSYCNTHYDCNSNINNGGGSMYQRMYSCCSIRTYQGQQRKCVSHPMYTP